MERLIDWDTYETRNKEISHSGGGGNVKCSIIDNNNVILKRFPKHLKWRYLNEKKTYLQVQTKYIPTLLYYDDINLILIIEDVGDSLEKLILNNEHHKIPANIIDILENIIQHLYKEYNLLHGDIMTRNICIRDNNVYLIDFEWITEIIILSNNKCDFVNSKKEEHHWHGLDDQIRILTDPDFLREYITKELYNKEI